jgi:bifunctional non-homologous end joining protein LigD
MIDQKPMLASASKLVHADVNEAVKILHGQNKWIAEAKLDGIRCLAHVEDGEVTLINRRNTAIGFRYPEVVAALKQAYPRGHYTLDGEIICQDKDGNDDFINTHIRDAQQNTRQVEALSKAHPATYVAFDCLVKYDTDIRDLAYSYRRATLLGLSKTWRSNTLDVVRASTDIQSMWDTAIDAEWEGLIVKKVTSRYNAGRSRDWVKIKRQWTITVLGYGLTKGEGYREATFGAIKIGLIGDGKIIPLGECGSGFDDSELNEIKTRMEAGEPLVMEITCQDIQPSGELRFPVFIRLRGDIDMMACGTDQLEGITRL